MPRPIRLRGAALFATCLALALAIPARAGADEVREERISLPAWEAELPGSAPSARVQLPSHLDASLPHARSNFTLRTSVDVPPALRGRPLTLVAPHLRAPASLLVDGAEAVAIDPPEPNAHRATRPQRWRVPESATRDGALELELHVDVRVPRAAWIDGVPSLTTALDGGAEATRIPRLDAAAAWFALAASVVVALLYGYLFVSKGDRDTGNAPRPRGERLATHGWFALGATCGIAYPAFVLGLTQPLLGDSELTWVALVLAVGSVAAMAFSRAYADAEPPSRLWWVAIGATALFSVVYRDPFQALGVVAPLTVGLVVANAVAQLAFIVSLKRARREVPLSLFGVALGWPAAAAFSAPDLAALLGQGEPAGGFHLGSLAIAALCVYQALALSREHLSALARADDLVAELGERVRLLQAKHREVELLNDELRRQIAARSRELAEKLAQMGAEGGPHADVAPPELLPGDILEDRYRVEKLLGTGGMGAVYEVERLVDGRHFALKALSGGGHPEQRARFAREAQIVAEIDHPNVVSIVDVDVAKSGFIFLVMDLVESGTTLHDVRRRHRDVPWTVGVLAQVADGLAAIHEKGIVHRDLKPANVLLSRGGDGRRPMVKITDFGIATLQPDGSRSMESVVRGAMSSLPPAEDVPSMPPSALLTEEPETQRLDASGTADTISEAAAPTPAPLTRTGIIFGTPQYMAQELAHGTKHATRASDVFALGILAFELLTGKRPFVEGPVSARLEGRPLPAAPRFRKVCPTLPLAVAQILDRAMSHDPGERPTALEIAEVLNDAADALQR